MDFNDYYQLLKEYQKNPRAIGTVAPDSRPCIDALLKHVPFRTARMIVEYGPAIGTVTKEILARMSPQADLVCIEQNKRLYDKLVGRFSGQNVHFVNADAAKWGAEATFRGRSCRKGVDCIISTLPCSNMDFDPFVRDSVLPILKDGGCFIQYMHVVSFLKGFRLDKILNRHFPSIESDLVYLNFPPAMVYSSSTQGKMPRDLYRPIFPSSEVNSVTEGKAGFASRPAGKA